jgi:hypothetical protein
VIALTALAGADGIRKAVAIVLAAARLVVIGAAGTGWWTAAGDRDLARAALVVEQGVSTALRASIAEQNLAVDGMARATLAAQQRGEDARVLAAARGRKMDAALEQINGVRATTCDEVMPFVNQMLESVK